jgi:hypothetical protein
LRSAGVLQEKSLLPQELQSERHRSFRSAGAALRIAGALETRRIVAGALQEENLLSLLGRIIL